MLTGPQNSAAAVETGLARTRERILAAARESQRDPGTVTLLAVSKAQPAAAVRAAWRCGQRDFGENYVQDALPKIASLADLDIAWHFIGRLQGNKTRAVAEHFSWVHTIDRERIARRLDDQRPYHAAPLQVCLEVCLDPGTNKGGVDVGRVAELAACVAQLPRLRLRGLMCIPEPRATFREQHAVFARLAGCLDDLKGLGFAVDTLSMGMSGDLEAAIAAGATIVRVGTAIFGERPRR